MSGLRERSIDVIAAAQHSSGAIVASPAFPTYRYCWFRDASFTAYAMDRVGRHDVSGRFFAWARDTIGRRATRLEAALGRRARGGRVVTSDLLHCRYGLDGSDGTDAWGNFQMDGYGALLWAFSEHARVTRADVGPYLGTMWLLVRYIDAFWELPQYDCWEERPGQYPATLACLYGGLRAAAAYLPAPEAERAERCARRIRELVLSEGVRNGQLVKTLGGDGIDASLLWCVVPFALLDPEHPVARTTVSEIERNLLREGLHRFPEDSYYGGGAWILLTAWLGWYYVRSGRATDAERLLRWIEAQADGQGRLPEQVQNGLLAPAHFGTWVERWGPPAIPLIWSHAMYLVLDAELRATRSRPEAAVQSAER